MDFIYKGKEYLLDLSLSFLLNRYKGKENKGE